MKKAILLVAYGASNIMGRAGLRFFENICRGQFADFPIRWAFSSLLLRERLARARQKSDSVPKALQRLRYENFQSVAIQPLQTIRGREHEEICSVAERAMGEGGFRCSVGAPLLSAPEDAPRLASALMSHLPAERRKDECVVFMGHGARHPSGVLYGELAEALQELDQNIYLGAMNSPPDLESILPNLHSRVVWLLPLLSIIGQHALRDMAGPPPTSWKSIISAQGHDCRPVLKGMAESEKISGIWLEHLRLAAQNLKLK